MHDKTPCCVYDGPLVTCPPPRMPVPVKRRKCRVYIEVPRDAAKTCFEFKTLQGVQKTDWKKRIQFRIYRRGTDHCVATYDPWDLTDTGEVCVFWDAAFLEAPSGLYEAEVFLDCKPCGFACLSLLDCRIDATAATHVAADEGFCAPCGTCGAADGKCACTCGVVPQLAPSTNKLEIEDFCDDC